VKWSKKLSLPAVFWWNKRRIYFELTIGGTVKLRSAFLSAVLLVAMCLPSAAHHSFSAEYDETKPVSVTGIVKKVEWQNPHIWFYVDVKDQSGKVTTWGFSGGPPGMLQRRGITREVLKVGDVIKVTGFRAKDGSNNASGGNVTFADGRQVFAGAAEDVVPKQ
jgi:hypothetical protein